MNNNADITKEVSNGVTLYENFNFVYGLAKDTPDIKGLLIKVGDIIA